MSLVLKTFWQFKMLLRIAGLAAVISGTLAKIIYAGVNEVQLLESL